MSCSFFVTHCASRFHKEKESKTSLPYEPCDPLLQHVSGFDVFVVGCCIRLAKEGGRSWVVVSSDVFLLTLDKDSFNR